MHHPRRGVAVPAQIVHPVCGVPVYCHRRKTNQCFVGNKAHRHRVTGLRKGRVTVARSNTHRVKGRRRLVKGHARRTGHRRDLRSCVANRIGEVDGKGHRAFGVPGLHHPRRGVAVPAKIVYPIGCVPRYRHRRQTDQHFVGNKAHRHRVTGLRKGRVAVVRSNTHRVKGRRRLVIDHARPVGHRDYLNSRIPNRVREINGKGYRSFGISGLHRPRRRVAVPANIVYRVCCVPRYRHSRQTKQRLARGEAQQHRITGLGESRSTVVRCNTHRIKGRNRVVEGHTRRIGHRRHLDARVSRRISEVDSKNHCALGVSGLHHARGCIYITTKIVYRIGSVSIYCHYREG